MEWAPKQAFLYPLALSLPDSLLTLILDLHQCPVLTPALVRLSCDQHSTAHLRSAPARFAFAPSSGQGCNGAPMLRHRSTQSASHPSAKP
ncbi:hypothetical protein V8C86DRAFT_629449 [Haematococcus lacustris]